MSQENKLAETVRKTATAPVVIKHGRTNGKPVLHVKHDRTSRTISSMADWRDHPLHPDNKEAMPHE